MGYTLSYIANWYMGENSNISTNNNINTKNIDSNKKLDANPTQENEGVKDVHKPDEIIIPIKLEEKEGITELTQFSDKILYLLCPNCSSILFISSIDTMNNKISHGCESCYYKREINFFNFLANKKLQIFDPYDKNRTKKCIIHEKIINYYCVICKRGNCDLCDEKLKNHKHDFFDLNKNEISKSQIQNLENKIKEEKNFFSNENIIPHLITFYKDNEKMKNYRNEISTDILFNNHNFIRILNTNIKVILLIIKFKKTIIDNYKRKPNDYLRKKNIFSIDEIYKDENLEKSNENIIYVKLLINSIKALKEYQKKYLFKYMDLKICDYNINPKDYYCYSSNIDNYPFMKINNSDLVLYFYTHIFLINIKTREIIKCFKFSDYEIGSYQKEIQFLNNNKFLLLVSSSIYEFEFKDNKLNKIICCINKFYLIDYVFKILDEKYYLVGHRYLAQNHMEIYNNFQNESILDINDEKIKKLELDKMVEIRHLKTSTEDYFFAYEFEFSCLYLFKFFINSKNKISYSYEKLTKYFKKIHNIEFINDNKFFFETRDYLVVYNLKNRQIESICDFWFPHYRSKEYFYNKMDYFIKRNNKIFLNMKLKYSLDCKICDEIYAIESKNKNEKVFTGMNESKGKYYFFYYDVKEKINFNETIL